MPFRQHATFIGGTEHGSSHPANPITLVPLSSPRACDTWSTWNDLGTVLAPAITVESQEYRFESIWMHGRLRRGADGHAYTVHAVAILAGLPDDEKARLIRNFFGFSGVLSRPEAMIRLQPNRVSTGEPPSSDFMN